MFAPERKLRRLPRRASVGSRAAGPTDATNPTNPFFCLSLDFRPSGPRNGYFERVDPAFARAFGYAEADLVARPALAQVHPDDQLGTLVIFGALARGEPTLGFENRYRCRDGTYRWLAWTAVPTPDGVVYAAARDVTASRTAAGQAAGAGLGQVDERLVSVSHDLQQPLTVIKGQAQVLERRLAGGEPVEAERLERSLAFISTASMQMEGMIRDILDTALNASGRPSTSVREATDLVALVRLAVTELQSTFNLYRFVFEADVPCLMAMVDGAGLRRVVTNLLANAVKYSPEGSPIRVSIRPACDPFNRASAQIVVQDQGIGIPASDLPHVFERFHRAANATGVVRGTGLGLAGARQIVQQHGGSIVAFSREGEGSSFSLEVPLALDAR